MAAAIVYHPAAEDVALYLKRGPVNFRCYWEVRGSDNVASSGAARERVVENKDLMITFDMPHMIVGDDLEAWEAFASWALDGGYFRFWPDGSIDYWFTCAAEDMEWGGTRSAPKKYGQSVKWRVIEDEHTPTGPAVVLRRFYGIAHE